MAKKWIQTELAWAAGFYDGEGCMTLHTSKGGKTHGSNQWMYPNIHLGQVDKRPLVRFVNALGFGKLYGPYNHGRNPHAQSRYDLFFRTFEEVQQVIACLWPYLSEPKKEQARKVMKKWLENG